MRDSKTSIMLITVLYQTSDGHSVRVTQSYDSERNRGHYLWTIFSPEGHILEANGTTASPPTGLITEAKARDIWDSYCCWR